MASINVVRKPKRSPYLPAETVFIGSDGDMEELLKELKVWGPLSRKVRSLLNFRDIDAILAQIQAEKS